MSAVTTVTINDVIFNANLEYTPKEVAQEFANNIIPFLSVTGSLVDANGDPIAAAPLNATTAAAISLSINNLLSLAENGKEVPVDPNNPTGPKRTHFITVEMARELEFIFQSLKLAGVSIPASGSVNVSVAQLELWKSIALQTPVLQGVFQAHESAFEGNRSLQALIELEYVNTGGQVLSDSLESLEDALSATKESLDILAELQLLHNRITAENKDPLGNIEIAVQGFPGVLLSRAGVEDLGNGNLRFWFSPVDNPANTAQITAWVAQFKRFASGFFGDPIIPRVSFLSFSLAFQQQPAGLFAFDFKMSTTIKDQNLFSETVDRLIILRNQITELLNSDALPPLPGDPTDEQTLRGRLQNVLLDINKHFTATGESGGSAITLDSTVAEKAEGIKSWILDNFDINDVEKRGLVQDNLTFAVTAGENLNDEQKEEVRRVLFVFEEYYKSAAAILTKISQIIEKIAQGIAR